MEEFENSASQKVAKHIYLHFLLDIQLLIWRSMTKKMVNCQSSRPKAKQPAHIDLSGRFYRLLFFSFYIESSRPVKRLVAQPQEPSSKPALCIFFPFGFCLDTLFLFDTRLADEFLIELVQWAPSLFCGQHILRVLAFFALQRTHKQTIFALFGVLLGEIIICTKIDRTRTLG